MTWEDTHMATITAGDFRNGKTFEMDGKIMQVVEFQHVKPGKGAAFVRTKMKNRHRRRHRDFLQPHRKVRGSLRGAQGHGLQL